MSECCRCGSSDVLNLIYYHYHEDTYICRRCLGVPNLTTTTPTVTVPREEWERMRVEQNAWRQCEDRIASLDGYEHTTKCVIFTSFFEAQMKGIALTPSNAVESQNTQ